MNFEKSISFLWTSAPLIAGAKIVTRRDWSQSYASRFDAGDLISAFDKRPDRGGRLLATIQLTARPRLEPMNAMPDSDYAGEGFAWLFSHPEYIPLTIGGQSAMIDDFSFETFCRWRESGGFQYVVRFELHSIHAPAYLDDLLSRLIAARPQLSLF